MTVADLVHVRGDLSEDDCQKLHSLLVDPLLQKGTWSTPTGRAVEIALLPGVTDTAADAVLAAAEMLDLDVQHASTGMRVEFDDKVDDTLVHAVVERLLMNPIIERSAMGNIEPTAATDDDTTVTAATIPIRGLDDDGLAAVGADRALYLDPEELRVIRDHFESIGRDPTDVEIETLAQTWSEHCAHKTFRAIIHAAESDESAPTRREPLMKQLRRSCTEEIDAPFVRSAFVGNAGVIEFTKGTTIALKAETHNHPSAVEPFGGANTGVGGVIRDVLGIAHRADRRSPTSCASVRPTYRSTIFPTDRSILVASRRASSTASPTTATRSVCPPSPVRSLRPGVHDEPAGVRRLHRRRTDPTNSTRAPMPAIEWSCSAVPRAATASEAQRSPRRRWTPPPVRSPGRACRSATRSSRSC